MTAPRSRQNEDGAAAQRVAWFRDLIDGRGAAAGLDPGLRDALRTATEGAANEIATRLHLEEQAVRDAAKQRENEERALDLAAQRSRAGFIAYVVGGIALILIVERAGIAASNIVLAGVVGALGPITGSSQSSG